MRTQWNLTYKNIETANERMQDAIDELNKSADLFDTNESNLGSIFQDLDTGSGNQSPFSADMTPIPGLFNKCVYGPPTIQNSPFDD